MYIFVILLEEEPNLQVDHRGGKNQNGIERHHHRLRQRLRCRALEAPP